MVFSKEAQRKGGKNRTSRLTAEERSASARSAAKARWSKRKGQEVVPKPSFTLTDAFSMIEGALRAKGPGIVTALGRIKEILKEG